MSFAFVEDMYGKETVLKNCKKCDGLQLFETRSITLFWILTKGGIEFFIDKRKDRDYAALVLECTGCGEEGGYII